MCRKTIAWKKGQWPEEPLYQSTSLDRLLLFVLFVCLFSIFKNLYIPFLVVHSSEGHEQAHLDELLRKQTQWPLCYTIGPPARQSPINFQSVQKIKKTTEIPFILSSKKEK